MIFMHYMVFVFLLRMMISLLSLMVSVPLFKAGWVFAKPMRQRRCVTIMDLFYAKYGKAPAAGLSLFTLFGDLFALPATLIGLGKLCTY